MILSSNVNKYLFDINRINKQQDFRLPNIDSCIVDRVAISGNNIVAYGIVKRMAEAIILLDQNSSEYIRAKAMKELMLVAEIGAKLAKCQQLHLFIKDEKLADSLIEHFSFVKSKDLVLVKDLF